MIDPKRITWHNPGLIPGEDEPCLSMIVMTGHGRKGWWISLVDQFDRYWYDFPVCDDYNEAVACKNHEMQELQELLEKHNFTRPEFWPEKRPGWSDE